MANKPFNELTDEEATEIAREITRSSRSKDEIRSRLTEAGFNGNTAVVTPIGMEFPVPFMALVQVRGPNGVYISA